MKRLFALLTAFVCLSLCVPIASADEPEGVFVPTYKVFMESFTEKVTAIDSGLAEAIYNDCFVDGKWISPKHDWVQYYYISTDLRIYEGSSFLQSIYITIPEYAMKEEEQLFKDLVTAAATSIYPAADAEFELSLFSNIHYDYVKESPAGYITMYWNCGVYAFTFGKMGDEYQFHISLSVYDGN